VALTDDQLDKIVASWNEYVSKFLVNIDSVKLLSKKNLSMYMALGVVYPEGLAERLVSDYVSSSVENTMGHLYELVMDELGPTKVVNEQKKQPGFVGLDFVQVTPTEVRLIDLAAAANTKNGGARTKSRQDMGVAAAHWKAETEKGTNENPMAQKGKEIVAIWAVGRGTRSWTSDGEILRLRGDEMWEYFGAGPDCLARVGAALLRNPVTGAAYHGAVGAARSQLVGFLQLQGFTNAEGELDWPALLAAYP
jgi:hypothetical protein